MELNKTSNPNIYVIENVVEPTPGVVVPASNYIIERSGNAKKMKMPNVKSKKIYCSKGSEDE